MRRRDFVRHLPVVTGGLAAGATLPLAGCATVPYLTPVARPGALVVATEDVAGGAFVQGGDMERPIWLWPAEDGSVHAVLASCTHQGCQPAPAAGRLVCPCHGSEFSMTGEVLTGPADRPLVRYRVEQVGDELVIRIAGGAS